MKPFNFSGELFDYKAFKKYSDLFIETGCANGDGVQRALNAGYTQIISIEAAEFWHSKSYERFKEVPIVNIVLGKSVDVLERYKPFIGLRPIIFYLDAHSSGESSFGFKEVVAGDEDYFQDSVIRQEMRIILSTRPDHVIIIDDVNGDKDGCAEGYAKLALEANPDYNFTFYDESLSPDVYYKDKILVCHL